MAILSGHLSMNLIVSAPDGLTPEVLLEDLERAGHEISLEAVTVDAVEEVAATERPEPSHVVTVYGADHPGIVASITGALAEAGANVTDLQTRLSERPDGDALYVMLIEVALPVGARPDQLEETLRATAHEQTVDVSMRPLEQDRL